MADWGLREGGGRQYMGPPSILNKLYKRESAGEMTFESGIIGNSFGVVGIVGKVAPFGRNIYWKL